MDFILGTEWLYSDISNQIPVKNESMDMAADDNDKENIPPKKVFTFFDSLNSFL